MQIERRRSIKIWDFFDYAIWSFLAKNCQKTTVFLDGVLAKVTIVGPRRVSWRSNQEWRSICADTVVNMNF